MSVAERYATNYDRIAQDHVAHWRQTGRNPFQDPAALAAHEQLTLAAIQQYAPAGARILDAACGMGDLLLGLHDYRAQGCDIAEPYLEVARQRGLQVRNANIEKLPYRSNSFDVITATDVLEHVLDLNAATKQLVRVLKPGGHLIVRVPDNDDLTQYASGQLPYEFIHLRTLNESALRILLQKIFSLQIIEVTRAGLSVQIVARK